MPDDVVYDLETFPNCFSAVFANTRTKDVRVFEISDRRNDEKALRKFMRDEYKAKNRHVGFNNLSFDYSVLHFILFNKGVGYKAIYDKAMSLIDAQDEDKFAGQVKAKDIIIPQIDLYKINHYDNRARSTSLKMIEFNMRMDDVSDLPFLVGTELTDEQKDVLIDYNVHDVMATVAFYNHNREAIEFRENLGKQYNKNLLNFNDTKIGKDLFISRLEEESPGSCYRKLPHGGRKINQTKRDSIKLEECIVDYVKFDRPEFNAVLDWLKKQEITETKGVFSYIEEHNLGDVAKYACMITKQKKLKDSNIEKQVEQLKKEHPLGWYEERELKSSKKPAHYFCWRIAENLNLVVDGLRYDYGVGGLHSSVDSQTIREDDEYEIIDVDAKAMYPSLFIVNKVKPEHLGDTFTEVYGDILTERDKYAKGSALNKALKLAANGSFGDTNNEYSPLYDPKATMTITLAGQLSLSMLCEKLLTIDGLMILQNNTDGTTVKVKRADRERFVSIVTEWENTTGLVMEYAYYKAIYIRDCNNYIGHFIDDTLKNKGAYEYYLQPEEYKKVKGTKSMGGVSAEGMWHKGHSSLVIQKAAEYALVRGGDIEHFIHNHKDKYDFMLCAKVPRSSRLVAVDDEDNDTPEQNICRYYIAKEGKYLTKIMPPLDKDVYGIGLKNPETGEEIVCKNKTEENRAKKQGFTESVGDILLPKEERRISINTGWRVKTCNDIKSFDWDIDYNYYVQEAEKLVKPLSEG
jgi:hypothetical protein